MFLKDSNKEIDKKSTVHTEGEGESRNKNKGIREKCCHTKTKQNKTTTTTKHNHKYLHKALNILYLFQIISSSTNWSK